jgi:hypothetical protein
MGTQKNRELLRKVYDLLEELHSETDGECPFLFTSTSQGIYCGLEDDMIVLLVRDMIQYPYLGELYKKAVEAVSQLPESVKQRIRNERPSTAKYIIENVVDDEGDK